MDRLSRNALRAREAGMTYGKWKALQPVEQKQEVVEEDLPLCEWCGTPFKPTSKRPQKYCNYVCCSQANAQRVKERKAAGNSC